MNFNLLLEQVLFENELFLISEQAEAIANKLENLSDFADTANKEAETAKQATSQTGNPIDVKQLAELRNKLMELVSTGQRWNVNLTPEEKEKKLDDYIQNAYIDASTVVGLNGERLPHGLNLKGLRYLHRRFIKGY
jgi:hypothetical protein